MKKYGLLFFFASTVSIVGSDKCPTCRQYIPGIPQSMCRKHIHTYSQREECQDDLNRLNGCTCKSYTPGMYDIGCKYHMALYQQGQDQ